eukprot:EG_transcript_2656
MDWLKQSVFGRPAAREPKATKGSNSEEPKLASSAGDLSLLPPEVIVRLLQYLPQRQVLTLGHTCRPLRFLCDDKSIWGKPYADREDYLYHLKVNHNVSRGLYNYTFLPLPSQHHVTVQGLTLTDRFCFVPTPTLVHSAVKVLATDRAREGLGGAVSLGDLRHYNSTTVRVTCIAANESHVAVGHSNGAIACWELADGSFRPLSATEPAMHAVWFPVESLSLLSCCGVALSSHGRAPMCYVNFTDLCTGQLLATLPGCSMAVYMEHWLVAEDGAVRDVCNPRSAPTDRPTDDARILFAVYEVHGRHAFYTVTVLADPQRRHTNPPTIPQRAAAVQRTVHYCHSMCISRSEGTVAAAVQRTVHYCHSMCISRSEGTVAAVMAFKVNGCLLLACQFDASLQYFEWAICEQPVECVLFHPIHQFVVCGTAEGDIFKASEVRHPTQGPLRSRRPEFFATKHEHAISDIDFDVTHMVSIDVMSCIRVTSLATRAQLYAIHQPDWQPVASDVNLVRLRRHLIVATVHYAPLPGCVVFDFSPAHAPATPTRFLRSLRVPARLERAVYALGADGRFESISSAYSGASLFAALFVLEGLSLKFNYVPLGVFLAVSFAELGCYLCNGFVTWSRASCRTSGWRVVLMHADRLCSRLMWIAVVVRASKLPILDAVPWRYTAAPLVVGVGCALLSYAARRFNFARLVRSATLQRDFPSMALSPWLDIAYIAAHHLLFLFVVLIPLLFHDGLKFVSAESATLLAFLLTALRMALSTFPEPRGGFLLIGGLVALFLCANYYLVLCRILQQWPALSYLTIGTPAAMFQFLQAYCQSVLLGMERA